MGPLESNVIDTLVSSLLAQFAGYGSLYNKIWTSYQSNLIHL